MIKDEKKCSKHNYRSCEYSCLFLSCFRNIGTTYKSSHQDVFKSY